MSFFKTNYVVVSQQGGFQFKEGEMQLSSRITVKQTQDTQELSQDDAQVNPLHL